ncbi:hypothetical protein CVT26_006348 [Gymnopilus dilepis]|uniref:DUF6593 domain-containing protein n=1 Tax=Gymnopilus dilepis TaxID=231916 RepID=A0A409W627_9AGAR|nr:hypothetical protein CVT26_006348 [Gymnopilus dilepis]
MTTVLADQEFNASQITLVSPEPTTTLIFSSPSTLNTTLSLHGVPLYKLSTVDAAAERTTISHSQTGDVLVTIRRRDVLPSTVVFSEKSQGGERKLKLKEWLREDVGSEGWRIDTPVGEFVWRTDEEVRLALCPADNLSHPIAWATGDPFGLVLTRGTEQFREEIVASFIILEHRMRMEAKYAYLKERRFYRAKIATKFV